MAFSNEVDGIDYSSDAVESVRELLIELRDATLEQNQFEYAVLFSHIIAYLTDYREGIKTFNE